MTQPEIAPAREADVPLILSLITELAEFEKLKDQVVATEANLKESLFGPRPSAEALIARSDGTCAGFALYFHNFSTFLGRRGLYLEDLYVRPAFRGRAIGKALLAHLAGECVGNGWSRLQWSVLDWNTPSIGFYQSLGAVLMDEWTICKLSGEALMALAESTR